MFIAIIKKLDGTSLDHGNFETEEAAMAWFQPFIDKGVYGPEYTIETSDVTASLAQEATNSAALQYLADSDWQVIRASERGEELSAEFKAERDAARLSIVR